MDLNHKSISFLSIYPPSIIFYYLTCKLDFGFKPAIPSIQWLVTQGYQFLFISRLYRVSQKKSVISGIMVQSCTFFVQPSCMVGFNIFWRFFIFLWYSYGPKKSANISFSQNQKVRRAKMYIYIYYFFEILEFYKY